MSPVWEMMHLKSIRVREINQIPTLKHRMVALI